MGCDIHPFVEIQMADGTWVDMKAPDKLQDRTYGRFAFLTGGTVRNYSDLPEILPRPRGYPKDGSEYCKLEAKHNEEDWDHSASYLTLAELLAVNYEQPIFDRRGVDAPTEPTTLRKFLGENWFDILKELQDMVAPDAAHRIRIVFDFDS
mgnify:CR=1 FL=1